MKNKLSILPGVIVCISAPPVPAGPAYTRKTLPGTSFSDLQRLFDLSMKNKVPGEKGYVYNPERILDDTICGSPL